MRKIAILLLIAVFLSQPVFAAGGRKMQGNAQAANGSADATIIAAQGAGKVTRVLSGFLSVEVAATGGGGECAIEDGVGGTRIIQVDADAVGAYPFSFGPNGYPMTANTLLNVTVDGAATTQATCSVTATAEVL